MKKIAITIFLFSSHITAEEIDIPITSIGPKGVDLLPTLLQVPPKQVAAWLGETIYLNVKLKNSAQILWKVNNKVICYQKNCHFPIDGKIFKEGIQTVRLLTINQYGSSEYNFHIKAVKGSWTPEQKIDPTFIKKVKSIKYLPPQQNRLEKSPELWAENNVIPLKNGNEEITYIGASKKKLPLPLDINSLLSKIHIEYPNILSITTSLNTKITLPKEEKTLALLQEGSVRISIFSNIESQLKNKNIKKQIQTKKLIVKASPGNDFLLSIIEEKGQQKTKVVSLSGKLLISVKTSQGTKKNITLPPKLLFEIDDKDQIQPFKKLGPKAIQEILEEYKVSKDSKDRALNNDHTSTLTRFKAYIDRADYFSIIEEEKFLDEKVKEQPDILQFLGIAKQELYQTEEAISNFHKAANKDSSLFLPAWSLAKIYIDKKMWPEAYFWLIKANVSLKNGDEEEQKEFKYLWGIVNYHLGNLFTAKNEFIPITRWNQGHSPAIQKSSYSFIKEIEKDKQWSFILPSGTQWGGNELSLPSGVDAPEPYRQKWLIRYLLGTIINWNSSKNNDLINQYGASFSTIFAYHSPRKFKSFDLISLDAKLWENLSLTIEKEKKNSLKLSQGISAPIIDGSLNSVNPYVQASIMNFSLDISYIYDYKGRQDKKHLDFIQLKQKYKKNISIKSHTLSLTGEAKQKIKIKEKENFPTKGNSYLFSTTQKYSIPFQGSRSAFNLTNYLSYTKETFHVENSIISLRPGTGGMYFITPWLLATADISYDITWKSSSITNTQETIYKPGISIMFTGIF